MKTLAFNGYSDDTFGEYNHFNDDYDNCASGSPIVWRVIAGDHVVDVVGDFAREGTDGGWCVGVQVSDDQPLPPWKMWFEHSDDIRHSPILMMEVPDGAELTCLNKRADEL